MTSNKPRPVDTASLRRQLQRLDAVEVESLCLDHFPEVHSKFGRGLRRDEMINLLLAHCRRNPEDGLRLADFLVQSKTSTDATDLSRLKELRSKPAYNDRQSPNRPSHLSMRIVLRIITIATFVVAVVWMIVDPGFEPLLAVLGGVATLAASFFVNDVRIKSTSDSTQSSEGRIDVPSTILERVPSREQVQTKIDKLLGKAAIVDHDKLFGVDEELERLESLLTNRDSNWIISLFGEGGIGKTALAYESVKHFAAPAGFTRVAWVSAKQRYFSASAGAEMLQDAKLQWVDLIRQMAGQLGIELGYARTIWLEDFRKGIRSLPAHERCLIVIDNLETIEELSVIKHFDNPIKPSERVVKPHKLLVTTRRSILEQSSSVVELSVNGLSPRSAYQFIHDLGKTSQAIRRASDSDLLPILTVTEGNPLLIKLIVRRFLYTHKAIPLVLKELRELEKSDIAVDLRNYLYVQSLEELESRVGQDAAKQIMNAFCPRPAGDQLSYEELQKYSGITDAERFEMARDLACSMSLIRVSGSTLERNYSIHSLLWEFTCRND